MCVVFSKYVTFIYELPRTLCRCRAKVVTIMIRRTAHVRAKCLVQAVSGGGVRVSVFAPQDFGRYAEL